MLVSIGAIAQLISVCGPGENFYLITFVHLVNSKFGGTGSRKAPEAGTVQSNPAAEAEAEKLTLSVQQLHGWMLGSNSCRNGCYRAIRA